MIRQASKQQINQSVHKAGCVQDLFKGHVCKILLPVFEARLTAKIGWRHRLEEKNLKLPGQGHSEEPRAGAFLDSDLPWMKLPVLV